MNTLWIIIIAIICAVIVIAAIASYLVIFFNKKRKIADSERKVEQIVNETASTLATKLGNNDNIEKIENNGSRVSVYVKDMSKVDKDEINKVIENTMFMNNKIVFIIGSHGEEFKKLLEENISKISN